MTQRIDSQRLDPRRGVIPFAPNRPMPGRPAPIMPPSRQAAARPEPARAEPVMSAPPIPAPPIHAPVGFAPAPLPPVVPPPQPGDPLDRAGAAIIAIVRQAAERTADEADRALLLAHGLAQDLRVAEERAARLEAEVARLRQRAANAEGWLARIHQEIGDKLLTAPSARSSAG